MSFGQTQQITYTNNIRGNYGEFKTPAGLVSYIQTNARLGPASAESENRLATSLAPVREVLDTRSMNFNQLLQRDLDDHRIATELIPYIIEGQHTGHCFFPPIMAVVLPFEAGQPGDSFPATSQIEPHDDSEIGTQIAGHRRGEAYAFERISDDHGLPTDVRYGRLSWNPEHAKLVVMDGQHRAMALLAINRTVNSSWSGAGARYEPFYSEQVRRLIGAAGAFDICAVQFPVIVCWFGEESMPGGGPHEAARKLFVDVNKNARPPSSSRLILLSDSELSKILTREVLNKVRDDAGVAMPIYAIEYDNPEGAAAKAVRWSALTTLDIVRVCVLRATFGPQSAITDMTRPGGGRPNWSDRDEFMRKTLSVDEYFSPTINDGPAIIEREELGNRRFPTYDRSLRTDLFNRFAERVGDRVIELLSQVRPYRIHLEALNGLESGWTTGASSQGELAKDAIFHGMGMYWTLRDAHQHYRKRLEEARSLGHPDPTEPDTSKAWKLIVDDKKAAFEIDRARRFMERGSSSVPTDSMIQEVNRVYDQVNTQACQVGLVLAWATCIECSSKSDVAAMTSAFIDALNRAFDTSPVESRKRWTILSKYTKKPLNVISKLDSPMAIYFRYFWLEMLCIEENVEPLAGIGFDMGPICQKRDQARDVYKAFVVKDQKKLIKGQNPAIEDTELESEAVANAHSLLSKALKHWFDIEIEASEASEANDASESESVAEEEGSGMSSDLAEEQTPEGD